MPSITEIASVPLITAIVYGAVSVLKNLIKCNNPLRKFLPCIAAAIGIGLGIFAFYIVPDFMPATNLLNAILLGGGSGLSATGVNQIYKQLTCCKPDANNADKQNQNTDK